MQILIDFFKYIQLSSIFIFFLGMLTTLFFKKYDFKKQYHKEIINRRIVCYENIISFLDEFTVVSNDNNEGLRYFECMVYSQLFNDVFKIKLELALKNSMFINRDTREILFKLHNFYEDYRTLISDEISEQVDEDRNKRKADENFIRVNVLCDKLKKTVINDLNSLHKLKFSKFIEW